MLKNINIKYKTLFGNLISQSEFFEINIINITF